MSRLARDPHPRTTTTKPSDFTSAAAQLLPRHDGREAGHGESIEFFSALRKCLPDPHVSGQTARGPTDRRGKARRGGSGDELLSTEIGKHDYDWLLTPPGTPLWSPATSASGRQVSTAAPSRLANAGSASSAKSNSRLATTGAEEESPTLRLSKCSSAAQHSVNVAPSGRLLLRVRTSSSSASASSINSASNASVSSTPLWSAGSSPRTPGKARSTAATAVAQPRRRDKARQATGYAAVQPRASSKPRPGPPAPTCSRAHPAPGFSSPRSTTATSRLQALTRRATAAPRSRLASTTGGTVSTTPQPSDARPTGGAPGVASSSNNGIKSRPVPAAVKQDGVAAANTTTTQGWRQSLAPAIAAARSARREISLDNVSPRNSASRNINDEKATPHRTAAAVGSDLTRTGPRKSATNTTNAKRTVKENDDRRQQDAKYGGAGAPTHRNPALLQETSRSGMSRSHLGLTAAASKPGSIATGRRPTSGSGQHVASFAAAARIAGPDAFPSTRYDAMLLREDPKNLTWLRGCDEGDDGGGGGLDYLVDSSLEPFGVATVG